MNVSVVTAEDEIQSFGLAKKSFVSQLCLVKMVSFQKKSFCGGFGETHLISILFEKIVCVLETYLYSALHSSQTKTLFWAKNFFYRFSIHVQQWEDGLSCWNSKHCFGKTKFFQQNQFWPNSNETHCKWLPYKNKRKAIRSKVNSEALRVALSLWKYSENF